jgi:serine/alanine adding enzyme
MNYTVLKNEQLDYEKWNKILDKSEYANPFQTITYFKTLNKLKYFSAEAYAIESETGDYVALCVVTIQKEKGLKSFFSKRAIIYGGIVIRDRFDRNSFQFLLNSIEKDLKKRVIYIESRNYFNYKEYDDVFKNNAWIYTPYLNIKISLTDNELEDIIKNFKYNRRRETKLTLSNGITYKEAKNLDQIQNLYSILLDLYKQRVGLPVPHIDYFIALWKNNLLKIFLVCDGTKIIGGSFCTYLTGKGIYTYYYCGLRDYKKSIWPTHISILAAIHFGIENNLKFLDFMGAGIESQNEGIRKYKMEFGGSLQEEGRYLKINKPFLYWLGKKVISFVKKKTN